MTLVHHPLVTMLAAGVLGLIFVVLSIMVTTARVSGKVILGSGEGSEAGSPLFLAVRTQANFAEYAPLALLLIGFIEMAAGSTLLVQIMAVCLVLARLMHPVGMRLKAPNPFRAGGFLITLGVLLVASVEAVLLALR